MIGTPACAEERRADLGPLVSRVQHRAFRSMMKHLCA
jgi:hypothetical protein